MDNNKPKVPKKDLSGEAAAKYDPVAVEKGLAHIGRTKAFPADHVQLVRLVGVARILQGQCRVNEEGEIRHHGEQEGIARADRCLQYRCRFRRPT